MLAYISKRLFWTVTTLLGVSLLVFLTMHLAPGDPAHLVAGMDAPPETIELIRKDLGLDQPLHVQFVRWMGRIMRGDFGRSLHSKTKISEQIASRLPTTAKLAGLSMIFGLILGLTTGMVSAIRHRSWFDNVSMVVAMMGTSMPIFWLGLLLMLVFAIRLDLLPVMARGDWRMWVLPTIALGTGPAGLISRLTRSSMLGVLGDDYVRTARSKGLSERIVIYKHALRNAMIPVVTTVGVQLGNLLAGSVVTETVFGLPGIGEMMISGIMNRDFPMVQGPLLIIATSFLLINLITDLLYCVIDPTIRLR